MFRTELRRVVCTESHSHIERCFTEVKLCAIETLYRLACHSRHVHRQECYEEIQAVPVYA